MPLRLAQQRLKRRLLQPASTAHPGADLPQRKIRVSRYVFSPEPNPHPHKTSDTIAIGCHPSAQAFASPGFVRLNRTRGITIMMPSRLRNGSREFIVGRAVCTGTSIACYPAGTEHQRRCLESFMPAADLGGYGLVDTRCICRFSVLRAAQFRMEFSSNRSDDVCRISWEKPQTRST